MAFDQEPSRTNRTEMPTFIGRGGSDEGGRDCSDSVLDGISRLAKDRHVVCVCVEKAIARGISTFSHLLRLSMHKKR